MPKILAVTGYAGAGKTTAVNYCENLGIGRRVYVGQFIVDEVVARKLAIDPENEKAVRLDLRKQHGPACLAILAAPTIDAYLKAGVTALVDAVLSMDELQYYQNRFGLQFELLGISASFSIRASRLSIRGQRAMNENQLRQRDELELINLRTNLVLNAVSHTIDNDGSLEELHDALNGVIKF